MAKKHSKEKDMVLDISKPVRHLVESFKIIFKNYKLFLPLMIVAAVLGGVSLGVSDDAWVIIMVLVILMLWLATLIVLRHLSAGKEISFRDAIYNAMGPIIPTLIVLVVLLAECIPIFLLIIGYSSAVETNLFGNVFYGSIFVLVALGLVAVSAFFATSSLMGLVAVSVPGTYPVEALMLSSEMMKGRKMKMFLRLLILVLMMLVIWLVVMVPVGLIQNATGWQIVGGGVFVLGCFSVVYVATYLYLYYRWLLNDERARYDKK